MKQDFPVDYALLRAAIIARCTRMFEQFRRNGRLTVYCGTPPDLLLLHIGVFYPGDHRCQLKRTVEAFTYSDRRLEPADLSRKPSRARNGVYYEEAYAQAGWDYGPFIYITMNYGPGYASCFAYDLIDDGRDYRLVNQQLVWLD